jgi:hypothetical protein
MGMGMRGLGSFRRCIFDVCFLWYCLQFVSGFSLALGMLFLDGMILPRG